MSDGTPRKRMDKAEWERLNAEARSEDWGGEREFQRDDLALENEDGGIGHGSRYMDECLDAEGELISDLEALELAKMERENADKRDSTPAKPKGKLGSDQEQKISRTTEKLRSAAQRLLALSKDLERDKSKGK